MADHFCGFAQRFKEPLLGAEEQHKKRIEKPSGQGMQWFRTALMHLVKGVLEAYSQCLLTQSVIAALDRRNHLIELGVKAAAYQK